MNSRFGNLQSMPILVEQENNNNNEEVHSQLCDLFTRRELTLSLVNQLNHIVKAVQRHRGISMGLLAGNKVFEKDFHLLQMQLQKRIALFETYSAKSDEIIKPRDLENIRLAWQTIRDGWQDDRLSDNFELHSHFIEQLFSTILALSKMLETPLLAGLPNKTSNYALSADNDDGLYPKAIKKIEVLDFICSQLPVMIEFMAKIRGLATYCAALGEVDETLARKLRFFIDCARERNEKIRHCGERLRSLSQGYFHSLGLINELETKFVYLLSLIEGSILTPGTVKASASQLFDLATSIIDAYWKIVEEGLYVVRLTHNEELEDWVKEI
ncbi:hypothetical protein TDB9533_01763 [Thalassocella blandensis]|nr:hypothetical protein TDB9533_01763 [Thalassocella blandensis]